METRKNKWKNIKSEIIYMAVEYVIGIWVIITTIVNMLNLQGIASIRSGFMKSTFYGVSMLVLMLLQYGLMRANKGNGILNKIRPYIMGTMGAGVVSACNLSLCLMLMLLAGYFLVSGFTRKCNPKDAVLTLLIACVGIEVYSIIFLLQEKGLHNGVEVFFHSLWPDIIFVGTAVLYCFVDRNKCRKDKENFQGEGEAQQQRKERWAILYKISAWCHKEAMRLTGWIGGAICVIALGLFLYFAISVGIGNRKIYRNTEEVYLLRHCQDTSLALTLGQEEETGEYVFSFQKYAGTNNQKVSLQDVGDGACQMVFLSPQYAIGIDSQMLPCADPQAYSSSQYWVRETYDSEQGQYRFISGYGVPLCYDGLDNEKMELSIGNYGNDCEIFVLEQTTADEFITCMAVKHHDEFMPTMLMETCSTLLGGWTSVLYILIMTVFFGIVYLRRILGDKLAIIYALFFAFLLAYGSISAILLLFLALGLQCSCNHYRKSLKDLEKSEKIKNLTANK